MLRSLAWKEWREQRPAILAGFALAGVLPPFLFAGSALQDGDPHDALRALPLVFLGILWPLIAAAAGSITIANESEEGTLRFLLSRPISRARIWLVKVGAGLGSVAIVAAFSLLVMWLVNRALPADWAAASLARLVGGVSTTIYDPLTLLGATLLLYSCSVLCSALLTRALTAAAAGLALTMGVLAGILLVWSRLSLVPRLEPQWLTFEIVVVSLGVLAASLIVFARGEMFGTGAGAVSGMMHGGRSLVGSVLLVTAAAGVLPMIFANARLASPDAEIEAESVAFNGREIVMTVSDPSGGTTQLWMLRADGGGMFPLTGRHTFGPTMVPGDNWLAYLSRRGIAGGRRRTVDLRLVDVSGSEDRLVASDVPVGRPLFFNGTVFGRLSGGQRVAFLDGGELTVAWIAGRGSEVHDVSGTPLENAVVLGFTSDSGAPPTDALLFLPANEGFSAAGRPAMTLSAYRIESDEVIPIWELPEGWQAPMLDGYERNHAGVTPPGGWRYLAVIAPTVPTAETAAGSEAGTGAQPAIRLVDLREPFASNRETGAGTAVIVHTFDIDGTDRGALDDFRRCAYADVPPNRLWIGENGRRYSELQVLFADCTESARRAAAAARGERTSQGAAGLIRLKGIESGDERAWPLPADWARPNAGQAEDGTARIARIFLSSTQDELLLDIHGARQATSYALVIRADGTNMRCRPGWFPRGWLGRNLFLLQGESDGGVVFATGNSLSGQFRNLYPREREER